MDTEILKIVGQISGIGGLALGVFFILFKEIIRKKIFPIFKKDHAYYLMRLIAILIWSIAIIGIIGWILLEYKDKSNKEVGIKNMLGHDKIITQKTYGEKSPIITDSKGDVNINF